MHDERAGVGRLPGPGFVSVGAGVRYGFTPAIALYFGPRFSRFRVLRCERHSRLARSRARDAVPGSGKRIKASSNASKEG